MLDPCPTCGAATVVDFHLPRCSNPSCGRLLPCRCLPRGLAQDPYETVLETFTMLGVSQRAATFCRRCGDEVGLPELEGI